MVYLWLTNYWFAWKKIHTNVQEKNPLLTFSCMFRAMKKTPTNNKLNISGFCFCLFVRLLFFSWIFLHDHAENLGDSSNINQLIGMTWLVLTVWLENLSHQGRIILTILWLQSNTMAIRICINLNGRLLIWCEYL